MLLQNLVNHDSHAPWLSAAVHRGFGAVLALPLSPDWRAIGALTIYSKDSAAFTPEEVEMLSELADDLTYGIESLRARTNAEQAQEQLLAAAQQWRLTFDSISDPLAVIDPQGKILRGNLAISRLMGVKPEELSTRSLAQLFHQHTKDDAPCALARVKETRQSESEIVAFQHRSFAVKIDPMFGADGTLQSAIHVMDDITHRLQSEEENLGNIARLRNIMDGTIAAIAKIVEIRDPYTSGHQQRVSGISVAIAALMGLTDTEIEGLRVGGMLHDIGKLYVPSDL